MRNTTKRSLALLARCIASVVLLGAVIVIVPNVAAASEPEVNPYDLQVSMVATLSPTTGDIGYTITLTSALGVAPEVKVVQQLPPGVSLVSVPTGCVPSAQQVPSTPTMVCLVSAVYPGNPRQLSLVVRPSAAVTNTRLVSTVSAEGSPHFNSDPWPHHFFVEWIFSNNVATTVTCAGACV